MLIAYLEEAVVEIIQLSKLPEDELSELWEDVSLSAFLSL